MTELIITNGDLAADLLRAACVGTDILPWRDILHDGPAPAPATDHGDGLERLSAIRADFLADAFDLTKEDVTAGFDERDRTLRDHSRYDEVTLWFEHDLCDQLQLLQILAFFDQERRSNALHLVQTDDYLGRQTTGNIRRFEALRASVTGEQTALAARLFTAFRKPTPIDLAACLKGDLSALPHMHRALQRCFEELPGTVDGLSRTQHHTLQLIEQGHVGPKRLFSGVQATEEAIFMGDLSFFRSLEELLFNKSPLIDGLPGRFHAAAAEEERRRYLAAPLTLTDIGRAVLAGKADHAAINIIDRWLGGTHVTGDMIWRWDRNTNALTAPS